MKCTDYLQFHSTKIYSTPYHVQGARASKTPCPRGRKNSQFRVGPKAGHDLGVHLRRALKQRRDLHEVRKAAQYQLGLS
jgi:hypothetical protein